MSNRDDPSHHPQGLRQGGRVRGRRTWCDRRWPGTDAVPETPHRRAAAHRALAWTFDRVAIDARRAWIAGFSDGASYALSLGIANGDFFSRVLAFSPGFVIPVDERGRPRFFVSHGRQDPILPIDQCSRRIVPELRHAGYDVRFDEFDGGHRMPPEVLAGAGQWLRA